MNREQRRHLQNSKVDGSLKYLETPCTINEAAQIARGVAEDTITDYHKTQGTLQVSLALQVEIIKDVLIEAGLITEEKFHEFYLDSAKNFQKLQDEAQIKAKAQPSDVDLPTMSSKVNDVEVVKE